MSGQLRIGVPRTQNGDADKPADCYPSWVYHHDPVFETFDSFISFLRANDAMWDVAEDKAADLRTAIVLALESVEAESYEHGYTLGRESNV